MAKGLFKKLGGYVRNVKTYWKNPMPGYYLSFKEAFYFCLGGMGIFAATLIPTYVTLSAGQYTAAALNIHVDDLVKPL